VRSTISVRTGLAGDLPRIMGDRVQLQQVTMNLIINSIDAMKDVDGTRELTIQSQRVENEQIQVSISDTGIGLPPQQEDQTFNAFFTTKTHGTVWGFASAAPSLNRMAVACGLPITPRAAQFFCFTLPATLPVHG
jgi:C4-dicarboxylate-specific signal transduction histidine kinase